MHAAAANALSIAASNALAGSTGRAFDMADAEAGLMGALRDNSPDDVRLAALGALANVATSKSQGSLSSVLGNSENSAAIRAAAARALGAAVAGEEPNGGAFGALLAALSDEDGSVATAAGLSLGSAKLSTAQRDQVYRASRGW